MEVLKRPLCSWGQLHKPKWVKMSSELLGFTECYYVILAIILAIELLKSCSSAKDINCFLIWLMRDSSAADDHFHAVFLLNWCYLVYNLNQR